MYFLLVGFLIKLWLGAPVGTLIVVMIKLFIAKVIRIFNFSCVLILDISSKGLKGLVKFYIINFIIFKLINII